VTKTKKKRASGRKDKNRGHKDSVIQSVFLLHEQKFLKKRKWGGGDRHRRVKKRKSNQAPREKRRKKREKAPWEAKTKHGF